MKSDTPQCVKMRHRLWYGCNVLNRFLGHADKSEMTRRIAVMAGKPIDMTVAFGVGGVGWWGIVALVDGWVSSISLCLG